jgi:hypothetical protein
MGTTRRFSGTLTDSSGTMSLLVNGEWRITRRSPRPRWSGWMQGEGARAIPEGGPYNLRFTDGKSRIVTIFRTRDSAQHLPVSEFVGKGPPPE